MNIIDEIKTRLSEYPNARYETDASSISVLPSADDGFTVTLHVGGEGYTVFFDGWHEDFDNQEEALNCFAFGLSDECRLKECRRGSFAYKWTVESNEHGQWTEDSTTGLLLFPFWKRPAIRYLQNRLLIRQHQNDASQDP